MRSVLRTNGDLGSRPAASTAERMVLTGDALLGARFELSRMASDTRVDAELTYVTNRGDAIRYKTYGSDALSAGRGATAGRGGTLFVTYKTFGSDALSLQAEVQPQAGGDGPLARVSRSSTPLRP